MPELETMKNRRMAEKIANGEAVSVHNKEMTDDGHYVLEEEFFLANEDIDFCNAENETWIYAIGRRLTDNVIVASHSIELSSNPLFECLWSR
jgi:ribosomal protein S1